MLEINMTQEKRLTDTEFPILEQLIQNPSDGLPEEVFEFVTTITPMVNVDLLIKDNEGRILLSWRDDDYCGRGWHIPGGIIRYKEKAEERVQKTAREELNSEVYNINGPIEIHEVFTPQAIRGHFISFLYECFLPSNYIIPKELVWDENKAKVGALMWHSKKPELVTGHKEIYAHLFQGEDGQ